MSPKSILGRYLAKQIVFNFLSVLFMVMGVVLMFEMVELLRKASGREDVTFWFLLQIGLTKMPRTMDMVFPFVMMIASMVTFWRVSKSNEFVIIRAAGVSIWGFLTPVLFAVFMVGVVNVTLVNPIAAKMYEIYETLDYRFDTRNPNAVLFSDKGLWMREAVSEDTFQVMQAKSARQEGKDSVFLRDVSILEMDRQSQPIRRYEAFAAKLNDGYFDLRDVQIYEAGKPTVSKNSLKYKSALTLDRIKENFVEPDAISFWNLPAIIQFYESSGFSAQKHKMRFYSLLVSPFLLCSLVLVAALFALRPNNRRGGVMYLIVGGITTGFVVYFMSQLIYAFGLSGNIPAFLAVCTPTLVASFISISILLHLEDG